MVLISQVTHNLVTPKAEMIQDKKKKKKKVLGGREQFTYKTSGLKEQVRQTPNAVRFLHTTLGPLHKSYVAIEK